MYYVWDFYVKGLSVNVIKNIGYRLSDLKRLSGIRLDAIMNPERLREIFDFTEDMIKLFQERVYWEFEDINRILIKNQRPPFFDLGNLKLAYEKVKELNIRILNDEEAVAIFGTSFKNYQPEVYQNDLVTVLDLYTDEPIIQDALKKQIAPSIGTVSGLSVNFYDFINNFLIQKGIKPLFKDVNDVVSCQQKRKELLAFLPKAEALKYWGVEENFSPPQIEPMVFNLEKTIKDVYDLFPDGRPHKDYIASLVKSILRKEYPREQLITYAKEANQMANRILFPNPENIEECRMIAKGYYQRIPLSEL